MSLFLKPEKELRKHDMRNAVSQCFFGRGVIGGMDGQEKGM